MEKLPRREGPGGGRRGPVQPGAHEAHLDAPLAGPRQMLGHAERMVRVLGDEVAGAPLAVRLELEHHVDPAAGWRGRDDTTRHPADQALAAHRYPKLDRLQRADITAADVRDRDVLR